jgi:hypothetical protein
MKKICLILLLIPSLNIAQSPTYPVLTGIIVDGCNTFASTPSCATLNSSTAGNCSEGRSEVFLYRAGTTSVTPAKVQAMPEFVFQYYTSAGYPSTPQYYTGAAMNNTTITSALNSSGCNAASCGSCFVDAWSNGIPAGATFMMVADYYCIGSTDFTSLCSNSTTNPIYVVYFGASTNSSSSCGGGTTGQWNASGNISNYSTTTPTVRYMTLDFSSLVTGAPIQYYSYNTNSLVNCSGAQDGAGIAFNGVSTSSGSPTVPTNYTSCQCDIPLVLPVSLLDFDAKRININQSEISFTTVEESFVKKFVISKSYDAVTYIPIAEIAPHNDKNEHTYKIEDDLLLNQNTDLVYYKFLASDLNSKKEYESMAVLQMQATDNIMILNSFASINIISPVALKNVELYGVEGKVAYAKNFAEGETELNQSININDFSAGFYTLRVTDVNQKVTIKKIVK